MTKKVFWGIFSTSLFTMLVCIFMIINLLCNYYNNKVESNLESSGEYIAKGIESAGTEYLNNLESDNRITLISSDGKVLFDNKTDITQMENHADRKEFKEAKANGSGKSERFSSTLSEKTYYYCLKLSSGNIIRVSSGQYTLVKLLYYMLWPICAVVIIIIAVSVILAVHLSRSIFKPINNIDLENSNSINKSYKELSPLLDKINSQNHKIAKQMDELQRSQKEFAVISDNMSEGLLIIDKNGFIISYNQSITKSFQVSGDMHGKNILEHELPEPVKKALESALKGKHSAKTITFNGKYYEIIANPVTSENNDFMGAVFIMVDVTEKEGREKLRKEFTSNVSHELKTPLTSIYGVSDMMMSGIVKQEDICEFASDIHSEAGRLISLVNDIIKLSQLDEDEVPLPKEKIDMLELSKDVADSLKNISAKQNISIEVCGDHGYVIGVYDILYEMIYNLCDNAIKYNKQNGNVKVTVAANSGKTTIVSVEDTGIGIPQEHLDRIFERFYRVDKSHSKKIGGTGLGLSIVKHAALYHNAKISIDSKTNSGTKISIIFGDN